ncbi:hypothetical protein ACJ41O_006152 [Fusarium nematophilum]
MPLPYATSVDGTALDADDTIDSRAYQCTAPGCQRSYRRHEHLLRHVRAHNSQKPFKCPKCQKSYSRQDVLKRHVAQLHDAPKHFRGKGQNLRPLRMALSPSTSQVRVDEDWQRDMAENLQLQKSPSLGSSAPTLTSRPPESNRSDMPDVAPGTPLSVSSPNTTLQMVLDACASWAALPATPISSLPVEAAEDRSDTIPSDPFQLGKTTTTADCRDASNGDEPSLPESPLQLVQENLEDNPLRSGILEQLDDLAPLDYGTRQVLNALGHGGSPTVDTGHSPSVPQSSFPVDTRAFQECLDLYFERFHPQWPIVHRGTFDPATASRDLVSSMIMIGAWESGLEPWMEIAERWCESLVDKLSKNHSQAPSGPEPAAERTLQAYQALLLNVVFTLQCSDDMRFSKAYFRYCMMLAIFRQANLFEEQDNLAHDDPEDAIPTSWLNREKLKRLAFFSFRLDIYFYFLRGYNPVLRYDDLSLTTPSSERLWEATTAEEWHEVKTIESKHRTAMQFMTLMDIAMDCEGRDTLPALLEDDYLYGLCAMQAWFLRDINKHRSRWQSLQLLEASGIRPPAASSRAIEYWSMLLMTWRDCYRDRAIGSLLSSQKHREMTENNAMPLYHLSHMALRANLKAIKDLAVDRRHQQYSGTCRRRRESRILEWVKTPDARLAMWHAAQILKLFSNEAIQGSPASCRMDFIASVALYEAGLAVWAYTRSVQVCDSCSIGSTLQANGTDREPFELFRPQRGEEFQQWVNHEGREQIRGTILSESQCFGDG